MVTAYRDLDMENSPRMIRVYMGPTAGWQMVPVSYNRVITATGNYTVVAWDVIIGINQTLSAPMSVLLPKVLTWMNMIGGATEIIVKDLAGVAAANNITLVPFGADTIIGPSVITINRGSLQIVPQPNQTSWATIAGIE